MHFHPGSVRSEVLKFQRSNRPSLVLVRDWLTQTLVSEDKVITNLETADMDVKNDRTS